MRLFVAGTFISSVLDSESLESDSGDWRERKNGWAVTCVKDAGKY